MALSSQRVKAQASHADSFAACDQSLEACRSYCDGLHCESQCKDAFDACRTRVRVMKWLKSEGPLDAASANKSVEDVCSSCQEFCGVGVPNCFLKCKSVCEGNFEIKRESMFLRRAIRDSVLAHGIQ